MGDEPDDADEARVLGRHGGSPTWLNRCYLAFGVVFLAFAAVNDGLWWMWVQGSAWLLLGATSRFVPDLDVDARGVRRDVRRRIPWSQVTEVEAPMCWRPSVRLHLDDGRIVDLPRMGSEHVPGLRRLAGLDEREGPT